MLTNAKDLTQDSVIFNFMNMSSRFIFVSAKIIKKSACYNFGFSKHYSLLQSSFSVDTES